MADLETPKPGENEGTGELGTEGTPVAVGSENQEPQPDPNKAEPTKPEDSEALSQRLAALEKERDNLAQERNLLRNKTKELEKKRVEETEDYKTAYEEMLAEKERRDALEAEEKERDDARKFRDNVIASRSESVQKAAKALIDKNENNFAWRDARDESDARRQINDQLDALEAVLGVDNKAPTEPETYRIESNNPRNPTREVPFEDLSVEEMQKVLPRAKSR